jgi:hypothetical protein
MQPLVEDPRRGSFVSRCCSNWGMGWALSPRLCGNFLLFTGMALAMLGCCLPPHAYQGDGRFSHTCSRYVLDLGELDLSSPAEHVLNVGALPNADRWIIGLDVAPRPERPTTANISDIVIQIEMTRSDGLPVLAETRPLSLWAWQMSPEGSEGVGPAFVYSTGLPEADAGEPGRLGTGGDYARGTMFQPKPGAGYHLVVNVTRPAAEARYFAVRLKVVGASEIGSP